MQGAPIYGKIELLIRKPKKNERESSSKIAVSWSKTEGERKPYKQG
ncbi:MAG: hypothetical protein UU06_C0003G0022 [Parcubacteria group bacterium GW2011_GWB1_40_5]|nr:MAG: hypothetical protein UU06_C0003G0022 [Parcubacteria group bacterium GW2011_GWB1_40_5]